MKIICKYLLLFFCISNLMGQSNIECKFHPNKSNRISPELYYSSTAQTFVNNSLVKLGFNNTFIQVLVQDGIDNCYATMRFGYPTLILDVEWLNKFSSNDDWFHVYVIGHEIGHIIMNHLYKNNLTPPENQKLELEADIIGGLLLKKYYYPYTSLKEIYPKGLYTNSDYTHPRTTRRIEEVDKVLLREDKTILDIFKNRKFDISKTELSDAKKMESFQQNWNLFFTYPTKANYNNCVDDLSYIFSSVNSEYYLGIVLHIVRTAFNMSLISEYEYNEKIEYLYQVERKKTILLYKIEICKNGKWGSNIYNLNNDVRLINVENELFSFQDKLNYFKYLIYKSYHESIKTDQLQNWFDKNLKSYVNQKDHDYRTELLSISFVYYHFIGDYVNAKKYAELNVEYWNNIEPDLYVKNNLGIAYNNLGLINFRLSEYDSSLINYEKSLKLSLESNKSGNEELNDLYSQIARCYYHKNNFELSVYYIDKVTNQDDSFYYYLKGLIYYKSKRKNESFELFQKSCNLGNKKSCQALESLF